ncbi:hypothetical protein [Methylobacterium brachythecii]|uniref:Uncharacterized protein n=1 Tax=Methylobacterium brachythecii TaxID=1176177 RepID=A0A7W6F768_9HYPH|nr:hypothetical protein [Methylobacterium brachythecii]MBB3903064.1 hypothetical protein [Methylobacterium brachythecii]GLS45700.1 hypothetical protein GCM10007884_36910 [Methylobacterium brachythecii]
MQNSPDDISCQILRKLIVLLEKQPDAAPEICSFLLREGLFEIEIAALVGGAPPRTLDLVQIAHDVVLTADRISQAGAGKDGAPAMAEPAGSEDGASQPSPPIHASDFMPLPIQAAKMKAAPATAIGAPTKTISTSVSDIAPRPHEAGQLHHRNGDASARTKSTTSRRSHNEGRLLHEKRFRPVA